MLSDELHLECENRLHPPSHSSSTYSTYQLSSISIASMVSCQQLRPVLIVLELAPLTPRKIKDDKTARENSKVNIYYDSFCCLHTSGFSHITLHCKSLFWQSCSMFIVQYIYIYIVVFK